MLRSLHIENIAVIKCVDIAFDDGLTVLTGETGAGKSILIDSVGLLLGGKFNRELIRTGESSATVSAVFDSLSEEAVAALEELGYAPDPEDGSLLLRRVLHEDGRSTMRLGGQPITATLLRQVGRLLLNIHGQNDNQRLMQTSTHLGLLDAMGGHAEERRAYDAVYTQLCECERKLETLCRSDAEILRRREMLEYQIKDIEAVKLKPGEPEDLLQERSRLQNLEKITKNVNFASQVLDSREKSASVAYLLGRGSSALRQISDVIPEAAEMCEQLDDMMYRVRDIADAVRVWADEGDDPTARLDRIEGRLDVISRLQRKYGQTAEEILAYLASVKVELESLDTAGERQAQLKEEQKRLRRACAESAAVLTARRRAVADEITARIHEELAFLDMPKVRFAVSITPLDDFTAAGADNVEFLIATNPGDPLLPMVKIASGGELSRLMLALKSVLNDRDGIGTVVFDEVDTGISGKTSRKVGIRLRQMGKGVQVICITHAAQIASLADTHLLISKEERDGRMETGVRPLNEAERIAEIARILGGLSVTDSQRAAARDMIEEKENI